MYSVPFQNIPAIFGPKPIENLKTFIPDIFAIIKCPNSWNKMAIPKTKTKANNVNNLSCASYKNNHLVSR